jgi:hypothetical protein
MTQNFTKGILGIVCLTVMLVPGVLVQATANVSATADTTPPEIWITSPADGSTVTGKAKIMFYSFDLGGIDRYELYVDGELKQTLLPTARNMYFVWSSRENGPHTLICRAYDRAGNIGTSPQLTVYR